MGFLDLPNLDDTQLSNAVGGTKTAAALNATYGAVLRLESQPGVDPNGVTECASAIQTAINLAASKNIPLVSGSAYYKIATGITLTSDADLAGAVFSYTGTTGTAITVGNTSGIIRKNIRLPYLTASAKTATGWGQVAGAVGVKLLNTSNSRIRVPLVSNFESGLLLYGQGMGTTYNIIDLGEVTQNKIGLTFDCDANGYSNQNTFLGGRFGHAGSEGTLVAGTRHVLQKSTPSFLPDGNTFLGTSLEDPGVVEYIIESFGNYNTWNDCRWENFGAAGTKKVWFRGAAKGNEINGGYQAELLTMVQDAGTINNRIVSPLKDQDIWIPSGVLATASGGPVKTTIGAIPYWELRHGFQDEVSADIVIPSNWQKADIKFRWFVETAAAGNVTFNAKTQAHTPGATVGYPTFAGTVGPVATVAANQIVETTVGAGVAVTPGPMSISAYRDGLAASDTSTGVVGVLGILVTRVA